MKPKFLQKLFLTFAVVFATVSLNLTAHAQDAPRSSLPIPGIDVEVEVTDEDGNVTTVDTNIFADEGNLPAPGIDQKGQDIAFDLVFSGLVYVKIITAVVGILYLTVMGYMLVSEGDNEETVTRVKRGLTYTITAFIVISMAEDLGRIFDMRTGTILGSPQEILKRVRLFDRQVEILITFTKYMIGGYATLMIVRSAALLIARGDSEEETSKHRRSILYSIGGLLLLNVGDIFINRVFYKVDKNVYTGITGVQPGLDAQEGIDQLVGITNLIVTFTGPVAVLMLIIGAIMYATAGGEDEQTEKAKRLIFATVIGIVIIYGAFALVSTVISGRLNDVGALLE